MKVLLIAGARPNFMKIAPIYRQSLEYDRVQCKIVHTGQHYDYEMSQAFFDDLELPQPDFFLNAGSGTHAEQTARIMVAFEQTCRDESPDLIMVVGDVNSTLACSVVAKKMLIKVAHVEAGLRSFDLTMPEEINRMVTDAISDYFFVTEESGRKNLLAEGKPEAGIYFVGNVMIDNLLHQVNRLKSESGDGFSASPLKKDLGTYAFLTLHRPSNVDTAEAFGEVASALNDIARELPIVFPVHPRTEKMMKMHGVALDSNIHQLKPLGFREALYLWKDARIVLTDSGGLQEETTALGIPCVTLRENTERPITIEMGTNILGGIKRDTILSAYRNRLNQKENQAKVPPKWDGRSAERIWRTLLA
jgi:UDP-N-acetylglucosamine 2-epimerase (non-hydrolysing)